MRTQREQDASDDALRIVMLQRAALLEAHAHNVNRIADVLDEELQTYNPHDGTKSLVIALRLAVSGIRGIAVLCRDDASAVTR